MTSNHQEAWEFSAGVHDSSAPIGKQLSTIDAAPSTVLTAIDRIDGERFTAVIVEASSSSGEKRILSIFGGDRGLALRPFSLDGLVGKCLAGLVRREAPREDATFAVDAA